MKVEDMSYYDLVKLDLQYLTKHGKSCLVAKDSTMIELSEKTLSYLNNKPVQLHMMTIPDNNKIYWCCAVVDTSGQKVVLGAGEV